MAIAAIWNVHGQRARNGRGEQRTAAGHRPEGRECGARAGGAAAPSTHGFTSCTFRSARQAGLGALRSPLDVPPGSLESGVAWDPIVAIKSAR